MAAKIGTVVICNHQANRLEEEENGHISLFFVGL
jgi:hypothetical protein